MTLLEETYSKRYENALKPTAKAVGDQLARYLEGQPRIDRVTARAKDIKSFVKKAEKLVEGERKYSEPFDQIQDQIGARIITFFKSDVERVHEIILRYYRHIERRDHVPDSEWEFGYFGRHYILLLPNEVIGRDIDEALLPRFFELQIKTLFQHAWSEAEHDLGYKLGNIPLTADQKRSLAYTSAQAWGADFMFDELFQKRTRTE